MRIKDVMTQNIERARPEESIQSVAQRMATGNFGFMPVCEGPSLIGTVTDRDLTIRALASGLSPDTPVGEVMTRGASTLKADDRVHEALEKMGEEQIRRLPVVDDRGNLVGVVSIGDLSAKAKERWTGETLEEISKPGQAPFGRA